MNARSSANKTSEVEGSTDHPDTQEDGFLSAPDPFVGTAVRVLQDDLMFILQLRRISDPQERYVQLVSGADHFLRLKRSREYDLHAVGLLIPEPNDSAFGEYLPVTVLFGRVSNGRMPLRYLAITDTGSVYGTPTPTETEIFKAQGWQLLYFKKATFFFA